MKEDFRRVEFEYEKAKEDRKHMIEQIEKLGSKLEKEEEDKIALN